MSKLIAYKEPGKLINLEATTKQYRSDCCNQLVGVSNHGRCSYVALTTDGLFLACDEDGLAKELPLNFYIEVNSKYFPIQKIVGNAVFVRIKPVDIYTQSIWDYEIEPLTKRDLFLIANILRDDYQGILKKKFQTTDYKTGCMQFEVLSKEEFKERFNL